MVKVSAWIRVSKADLCRVCGKPDWCDYTPDGAVCCMRIPSDRPLRNGGWLHNATARARPLPKPEPRPIVDFTHWWEIRRRGSNVRVLAERLGVDEIALDVLGAAWDVERNAWAFPMRDASRRMIGMRLRADDGRKWALRGSQQGLFIPDCPPAHSTTYLCEGPTDTAAALTLGLYAIGRPSCSGQEQMIAAALRQVARRVVIVADNDAHGAGVQGAEKLQPCLGLPSCILIPPCKDLREMVRAGCDHQILTALIGGLIWHQGAKR